MRGRLFDWTGRILITGFLLLFLIRPLCFYVLLAVGFPPVAGNLISARALREYAAGVHPAWQASGHWADYDPLSGMFYLHFFDGEEHYSLSCDFFGKAVRDAEQQPLPAASG